MNPAHDTKTPAGVWRNNHLERPLAKAIDDYKESEAYKKGFNDGWNKAMNAKFPQNSSEFLR